MKGRKLKLSEAIELVAKGQKVIDGFGSVVETNSHLALQIFIQTDWYEYLPEPKPKTLAERYLEKFADDYYFEQRDILSDVYNWIKKEPEANLDLEGIMERFDSRVSNYAWQYNSKEEMRNFLKKELGCE